MRTPYIAALGTALLLNPVSSRAQKIIEKSAPVKAGERVELRLDHANRIHIRAGAGNQLSLRATVNINQNKLNDALQLDLGRAPEGGVAITSRLDQALITKSADTSCDCPNGHFWGNNSSGKDGKRRCSGVCLDVDYEISVPAAVELIVKTISGDIEITGLTGPVTAKSISGFVEAVWAPAARAELTLKTVTGEVYADPAIALAGDERTHSGIGYPVHGTIGGTGGAAVRLESVSGDIFFKRGK